MKLNREALAHYLDTTFKGKASTAEWELIGDGISEMSMSLNPQTETVKDVIGQVRTKDNGYEPSMDANPYYADPEKKLYPKLKEIAMDRKKGDACATLLLEVIVENTEQTTFTAYTQEVLVKVSSYGGGTEGVNFPFTIHENGKRIKGSVTAESLKAGAPVFTAG